LPSEPSLEQHTAVPAADGRPPTQPAAKERLSELDILRALAAIAVVLIHVTAGPLSTLARTTPSFWWNSLINQASRFSIGAFVLITGAALYYTYGDRARFSVADFYRRRLRGVVVPYVFWSAFYILMEAYRAHAWSGLPGRYAGSLLRGDAYYHLYFMVLIFQFYLAFPLVRTAVRSRYLGWLVAAVVVAELYLTAGAFYGSGYAHIHWLAGLLHRSDRLLPWWMGYFALGALLAWRLHRWRAWANRSLPGLLLCAGGLLAWMMLELAAYMRNPAISVGWAASEFRPSASLYSLVACVALLALARGMLHRWGRVSDLLLDMGRHSFGIYLIHPFVLAVYTWAGGRLHLQLHPAPSLAVAVVVVLGVSYLCSHALAALPGGAWVVGVAAARRGRTGQPA